MHASPQGRRQPDLGLQVVSERYERWEHEREGRRTLEALGVAAADGLGEVGATAPASTGHEAGSEEDEKE